MRRVSGAWVTLGLVLLAGCVPRAAPPPAPAPRPTPSPMPTPPPAPAPSSDWTVAPLTQGDWSYRRDGAATLALYGPPDAPAFVLRCEAGRAVTLARVGQPGIAAPAIAIRTSFGERRLAATIAHSTDLLATLPVSDPLLDEIAFSRGRFLVRAEGAPTLIIPAWPEPARVIEDCRT